MFILPGLIGLVIFIYARPFEFIPVLETVPFLYIFFGLAVLGFVIDFKLGITRLAKTPQLLWVIVFILWALATNVVMMFKASMATTVAVDLALFLLLAHGVHTFKGIEAFAAVVLACSLWVSAVCVHQGLQPTQCVELPPELRGDDIGVPDGRSCDTVAECYIDSPEPEAIYRCEHPGILGTTSITGRVRYLGVLLDPNETALVVAIGLPLALSFYSRKRNNARLALVAATGILGTITVIMSKSRGGILVLGAVLATYFIRRYRWRGALAAGLFTLPVLLLGGRGGDEAASSSEERMEALYEGIQMFRAHPFTGVGAGNFTEHHYRTAHNSFVLAPAELGVVGMLCWTTIIYICMKIVWTALHTFDDESSQVARTWGMALLSSFAGLVVGMFFLSFTYHFVLWIYVGLAGAYYSSIKRHRPDWHVPFGLKDFSLLVVGNIALLALLHFYVSRNI